jgi:beta-glucanase (GH16 family)
VPIASHSPLNVPRLRLALLGAALAVALFVAAPLDASAASPVGQPAATWNQIFGDEFDGTSLDTSKWNTCYVSGNCTNASNGELEWYVPEDVLEGGGVLTLRAERKHVVVSSSKAYDYTSGMIQSGGANSSSPAKFSFKYGYMEARAKVPAGQGLWPAFWTLPDDNTWPPEIDVMEILGKDTTTSYGALHWSRNRNGYAQGAFHGPDLSQDFHTYGVDWEPYSIVWYVDGAAMYSYTNPSNIPNKPLYLLANLAVGGDWPGLPDATTPFPSEMLIDYMRVWERAPYTDTTAPSVAITSPANGATVPTRSTVTISANASDDVAVTKIEFYVNGTLTCTDTSAAYTCPFKTGTKAGVTSTITTKAYDPSGNVGTSTITMHT